MIDSRWQPTLVLRPDGGVAGLGHAMRCVALAEAWTTRGGQAVLVTPTLPAWLEDRLRSRDIALVAAPAEPGSVEDLQQLISTAMDRRAHAVVIDGYRFGPDYQAGLLDSGWCVAVLDDYGSIGQYHADVVIDQNLGTEARLYRDRPVRSTLLLGSRYALVRSEFTQAAQPHRSGQPTRLLLALGGTPDRHSMELMDQVAELLGNRFEIRQSTGGQVQDMAEAMRWADLAVTPAGSISWELCLMGIPTLAFSVAHNQTRVRRELGIHEIAVDLGAAESLTAQAIADEVISLAENSTKRHAMTTQGRNLVDGKGPDRVVTALRAKMLDLVVAGSGHEMLLFEWANDPLVRKWAFSDAPISWDEHRSWFARKTQGENSEIYIAVMGTHEIGQVRFDCAANHAVISVTMSPRWRGKGLGGAMINAATNRVVADRNLTEISAEILAGNLASIRSFESAEFQLHSRHDSRRGEVLTYRWAPVADSTKQPEEAL